MAIKLFKSLSFGGADKYVPAPNASDVTIKVPISTAVDARETDLQTAYDESAIGVAGLDESLTMHIDNTGNHITPEERTTWNGKADTSAIPTKISQLANDSGYILGGPDVKVVISQSQPAAEPGKKILWIKG